MRIQRRGVIVGGALILITSCAAIWLQFSTFEPESASQRRLVGWLLQHSAEHRPADFQARLFARCQQEWQALDDPTTLTELRGTVSEYDSAAQRCWSANVEWFCKRWFQHEAIRYQQVAVEQRNNYLARRCDDFRRREWPLLTAYLQVRSAPDKSPSLRLAEWSKTVEGWIADAAAEKQTLQNFWLDLQWFVLRNPALWGSYT